MFFRNFNKSKSEGSESMSSSWFKNWLSLAIGCVLPSSWPSLAIISSVCSNAFFSSVTSSCECDSLRFYLSLKLGDSAGTGLGIPSVPYFSKKFWSLSGHTFETAISSILRFGKLLWFWFSIFRSEPISNSLVKSAVFWDKRLFCWRWLWWLPTPPVRTSICSRSMVYPRLCCNSCSPGYID